MQLRTSFVQEQRLKMNPQVYMSLKLMGMPIIELREKISEEIERNPALEIKNDPNLVSIDKVYKNTYEENYFETSSDSGFIRKIDEDQHNKFIEGVLARSETLQEYLIWQFGLENIDDEIRGIGEMLIRNLDDNGFHKENPEILLPNKKKDGIKKAISIIQGLDPIGTCTSGYKEALIVQINLLYNGDERMILALDHLEELKNGKFSLIAKKLGCTIAEIEEIFGKIKGLSPFPGNFFSRGTTLYITPDVKVIRKDDRFIIRLNNEDIPVLGVHPFFMELHKKNEKKLKAKQDRDFIRENIKEARWFINSINQRNHTLLRVSRAIINFQRDFFLRGPKYIAPLTLKDIAGEIGVHPTTVSRASNGKYMQTEWGIFEIRHFFSNSVGASGNSDVQYSKEGVKEILKELLSGEAQSYSDQKISELLAQKGVSISRRTVTKYRKELNLGSSYTR